VWAENWYFRPAEGYAWLTDPPSASTFKVRPFRDGTRHPRHPNVVFDGNGGIRPADGWEWEITPPASGSFRVRRVPPGTPVPGNPHYVYGVGGHLESEALWERVHGPSLGRGYTYRRTPPGPHPRYPTFVITPTGDFAAAEGYRITSLHPPRAEPVPAGTRHPRHPNVVFGPNATLLPAEGFRWAQGAGSKDPRVERVPDGTPHSRHRNVVFTADGRLRPAEGFRWVPNRPAGSFAVELKEGYRIVPGSDPDAPRVERVPAGTPHPSHPNVVFTADGKLRPAEGFTWGRDRAPGEMRVEPKEGYRIGAGSDPTAPRVERVPGGTPHPRHPNVVFGSDGQLRPAEGFRWAKNRAPGEVHVELMDGYRAVPGSDPRQTRVERSSRKLPTRRTHDEDAARPYDRDHRRGRRGSSAHAGRQRLSGRNEEDRREEDRDGEGDHRPARLPALDARGDAGVDRRGRCRLHVPLRSRRSGRKEGHRRRPAHSRVCDSRSAQWFLFGSPDRMIRLDMSEFQTWESISRILGDGEVMSESHALVNAIRRQPFSVVLLDEFEKASRNVWNLFLQIFDDGRLTDRRGNVADFRHALIVMTSNLGAAVPTGTSIGFASASAEFAPAVVERAVRQSFPPELLNRIDRVVVFRPLDRTVMRELLRKELRAMLQRPGLRRRAWAIEWDESAIEFLLNRGFTPDLGARPLRRAIERYVLAPLALAIVNREAPAGDQFLFLRSDGGRIDAVFVDPDAPESDGPVPASVVTAEPPERRVEEAVLDPRGTLPEMRFLQGLYERLLGQIGAETWREQKGAHLGRMRASSFWEAPDRFAILGIAEYMDRLETAVETAGSLLSRLGSTRRRDLRSRFPLDLVRRLAQQLYLIERALGALEKGGPRDAFLAVAAGAEAGPADADADAFAVRIGRMYRRWAHARRMHLEVIEETGADGVTPYRLVLAVSGFAAYPILEPEDGVHVLEMPSDDRGYARARARVTVVPQPTDPPAGGDEGARAQVAAALQARRNAAPVIVRRYREQPSPLVRDGVRHWRTGRLDRVLDGDFDLIVER